MNILVIGAAGMIGRKLVERLLRDGSLAGRNVARIVTADVMVPDFAHDTIAIDNRAVDFGNVSQVPTLIDTKPDVIFHLAAIVSGEAEEEFDKGYRINLDGTRALFESIRGVDDYCPRVVFASSIAVFGAPFPDAITDDYHLTPLTSYGTQKAISELLLTDFTRKGFLDGIGIRLPTIVVRPGKPNLAASGFFSNIIREPLSGKEAVLPVGRDVMHWAASPRAAVGFCIHAAQIDGATVGPHRNLTMPGVQITTGGQIDALRRLAGDMTADLIRDEPDDKIISIVSNWPRRFDVSRAAALGFEAEADFDAIIRAHVEDELGGVWPEGAPLATAEELERRAASADYDAFDAIMARPTELPEREDDRLD
ncbi:MAG: SDR family oxidoreductase [Ahrensia sp.]|nr:SDR family oxidoreductase [Ahrensia sp.]